MLLITPARQEMAGREERHTDGLFTGGGMATWVIPSGSICGQDAVGDKADRRKTG